MTEWKEPSADQFRMGDVWKSPRGQIYTVFEEVKTPGRRGQVVLRQGEDDFAGKRILKDWDDIGAWERGIFWIRSRSGRPTPVVTPAALRQLANHATSGAGGTNTVLHHHTETTARDCAQWMDDQGISSATHVGPFSATPLPSASQARGTTAYVKAGATIRNLHPGCNGPMVMTRTRAIKIHDIHNGYVHHDRGEIRVQPPSVCWAGTDGYWCYADANDVMFPEQWIRQHRATPNDDAQTDDSAQDRRDRNRA